MAMYSFRASSTRLRLKSRPTQQNGFTLVEVIVSSVVILVAMVGAIAAFNLIVQSVRGTGTRANQSRIIDADIAEISRLSEIYTACLVPQGAVPANPDNVDAACGPGSADAGIQPGNSFYYFPNPSVPANVNAFFAACRTNVAGNHITANFIAAVNGLPPPDGEVTRQAAARVPPVDASNHTIEITWTDQNDRPLRRFRISPLVSAWCP